MTKRRNDCFDDLNGRLTSGLDDPDHFMTFHRYDDHVTLALLAAVQKILGKQKQTKENSNLGLCFLFHFILTLLISLLDVDLLKL